MIAINYISCKVEGLRREAHHQINHGKKKARQPIQSSHKSKNHVEPGRKYEGDEDASNTQNESAEFRKVDASISQPLSICEPRLANIPNGSFTFKHWILLVIEDSVKNQRLSN